MKKETVGGIGRLLGWLNTTSPYTLPIGGPGGPIPKDTGMTHLKVLALLIAKNGFKPKVTSYGQFSGPFGLTQTDAHLLMELAPYLQGMIDGIGMDSVETLGAILEPELMALATEFEAMTPAPPPPPENPPPMDFVPNTVEVETADADV